MKFTSLVIALVLAGTMSAQSPVISPPPQPIVVNGQQYVPATPPPAPAVPAVAQAAAQAVGKVVPGTNVENLGQTFGSTLGGVINSFSDATSGAVDKTRDVTSGVVDKTGDVLSKTADKTGDLAGKALDRTFGKDKTVVQGLQDLGNTNVGKFAMVLAAWKVMGKDAVGLLKTVEGILVGVPLQIVLIVIYVWVLRRFFITRSVVLSKTGGMFSKERKVEYGVVNVTSSYRAPEGVKVISTIEQDARYVGLFLSSAIFLIVSAVNVAQVIF